jgi:hypothetical protein
VLAYISLGIGLSNMLAAVVFLLIWVELRTQIKNSPIIREDFRAAARRLMISVGFFGFPILEYLFAGNKQSAKIIQPYALVWGAGCALSLVFLIAGLITLIQHTNREKKTGSYRYGR